MNKKILLIQFDPTFNGETTLTRSLKNILESNFKIDVAYPTEINKKGKLKIPKRHFGKVEDYKSYNDIINNLENYDLIIFINSKFIKTRISEQNKIVLDKTLKFFSEFKNKKIIFYEHGTGISLKIYKYDLIFKELEKNGNQIRILKNEKDIPFYDNYQTFLLRTPFDKSIYQPILKNNDSIINFCINSRYASTKRPFDILPYFIPLIKNYKFHVNFRGNICDPVSIWFNIKQYFLNNPEHIIMNPATFNHQEIYNYQDFIIYAGNQGKKNRGRLEYALLEAIYYELPILVHNDVFNDFKYEDYGVKKEFLKKCFIELNEENLIKILEKEFDTTEFINNSKKLLNDFLPKQILERFLICIKSFN